MNALQYEVHIKVPFGGGWLQIYPDPMSLENARLLAVTIRRNQRREGALPLAVWICPAINPDSTVLH